MFTLSISFYKMVNTGNMGHYAPDEEDNGSQNYDLLELVIIRLGDKAYHGQEKDEGFGLLRFLNAVMYPHQDGFMDTISEYIDFSDNEELWREAERMEGLGESILEEGIEQGIEQGIRIMVETLREVGQTKDYIQKKMIEKYELSETDAELKMEQYWH